MITKFQNFINESVKRFAFLINKSHVKPYDIEEISMDELNSIRRTKRQLSYDHEEKKYFLLYTNEYKYIRNSNMYLAHYKPNKYMEFQFEKFSDDTYIMVLFDKTKTNYFRKHKGEEEQFIFKTNSIINCFKKIDEILENFTPIF